MAGIIVTGNHPRRLLPGVLQWYGFAYDQHAKEYVNHVTVKNSDKRYEDVVSMAGMGLAVVKNEAQSITYDDFLQGLTNRFVHVMYGKGFIISKEAMEDDQYAPKLAELGAKHLARSMAQTKETIAANVLNNGFSASYVGADNVALFSTAHLLAKGGTFQNKLTVDADLSETSLEQAIIDLNALVDDAGLKMAVMADKLIIHPNDMFNAERILKTPLRVTTADNDINAIKNMGSIPGGAHVNHFLTDSDAWFLTTNLNDNGIILMERTGVELDADVDFDTKNSKFSCIERYSTGWADPRGAYGSAGA